MDEHEEQEEHEEHEERRSLVVECPHCHIRVVPLKNNICPACRNNISDLEGVDLNRVALIIHESDELPLYCFSCNQYTERSVRVSGDTESALGNFLFGEASPENTTNVIIYLPQCEQCAELEEPKPVQVDYENQTMTFAVIKGFKERVSLTEDDEPDADDEITDEDLEQK